MKKPLSQEIINLIPEMVYKLNRVITTAGGSANLVGGAVVDILYGKPAKDWDLEVYGLGYDKLYQILGEYGPSKVGKSFGIIKLTSSKCGGLDLDISVPRRDNQIGVGHKDIDCTLDPNMTAKEAAMRRDFTINSLFVCLKTNCLIDYFGGLKDLQRGILRATDPKTFVGDPVRMMRAPQLLARKAKSVDPLTKDLVRGMVGTYPALAKERVYEEFKKLLLLAEKPSVGLSFMREVGLVQCFPELQALIGCEQNPEWHPEGDVWIHSLEVADSAVYAAKHVPEEWKEAFVFGALLHDVGKPTTTITPEMVAGEHPLVKELTQKLNKTAKEVLWTAYGHDVKGRTPAETFMMRLTNDKKLIQRSTDIVGYHMQPYNLMQGEARTTAYKRLHNKLRLDVLGWMSKCDCCGRPDRSIHDPDLDHNTSERCFDYFAEFGDKPIQKILQGRDLIGAGIKPGRHFGIALEAAYEAQIEGLEDKDELLKVALSTIGGGE